MLFPLLLNIILFALGVLFLVRALQFMRTKSYHDAKLLEKLDEMIELQRNNRNSGQ